MLIDGLGTELHLRAAFRGARLEGRIGIYLVEIFGDHRKLDYDMAIVDQRRHQRLGIELHVLRVELITPQDVE